MQAVVTRMLEMLNQRGPFQARLEPLLLPNPHPGDQKAYLVRLQFPRQTQPLCRLKVEITCDEPIYSEIRYLPVLHPFDEDFSAIGASYSLLEIAAEKMRALLQSQIKLQERSWGASHDARSVAPDGLMPTPPGRRSGSNSPPGQARIRAATSR